MRVLHPVTQREKFVASGVYRYTRGGIPVDGEEHFSIYALPDDSWFVRVDYDWRTLDGTSQVIEALVDAPAAGGRFQRIVAQLQSPSGVARETFDFHTGHVAIGVSGAEGVRRDIDVMLPEGYAVLMLKTTLAGIAAGRWPGADAVPVPAFGGYRSTEDKALLFDATLRELRREDITIGSETINTRAVELTGEFAQTLWLDPLGIAVRRVMGEVTADLRNYSRRAEPVE